MDDKKVGVVVIIGLVLIMAFISSLFDRPSSSPKPPSGRPAGMSDAEYEYVNRRMKQEGLDAKEADEATRAVWESVQDRRSREGK